MLPPAAQPLLAPQHGSNTCGTTCYMQDVIADETLRVMRRCVPAAVPGVMFLSGGQVG